MFLLYIKLKKRNYPYTLKTSARHQKQLCYLLGKKHFIPETVVLPSRKEIYFTGNSWIAFPETIIIYRKHIYIANNTLLFTFANNNYENHLIMENSQQLYKHEQFSDNENAKTISTIRSITFHYLLIYWWEKSIKTMFLINKSAITWYPPPKKINNKK